MDEGRQVHQWELSYDVTAADLVIEVSVAHAGQFDRIQTFLVPLGNTTTITGNKHGFTFETNPPEEAGDG